MKEIERKFKLKYLPKKIGKPVHIRQAYLMLEGNKQLRVRIIEKSKNIKAVMTYKVSQSDTERDEYEFPIPLKDAWEMYNSTNIKLEKDRYTTKHDGDIVDIDIYPDGLSVVEIEYTDLNKKLDLPDYCGKEITGMKKYSNIQIAKNNKKMSDTRANPTNDDQNELILTLLRIITSWSTTNDIDSPSHSGYISDEISLKFNLDERLSKEDEEKLENALDEIHQVVRKLK